MEPSAGVADCFAAATRAPCARERLAHHGWREPALNGMQEMTMVESLEAAIWSTIEIVVDSGRVRGSWAHDGYLVQVRTPYGDKTTQIGSTRPKALARMMLRELAKERGA